MPPPWRYTTFLDFLDHWQSLLAGLITVIAALIAVLVTVRIERRKAKAELKALRSSLAVEIRILIARAYGACDLFKKLSVQTTPITNRQVESYSHLPIPVVYPVIADRIGLLGDIAIDVVAFYGLIEVISAKANELKSYRTPDNISPMIISGLSQGYMSACQAGLPLLSNLKTDVRRHDEKDIELRRLIESTADDDPKSLVE